MFKRLALAIIAAITLGLAAQPASATPTFTFAIGEGFLSNYEHANYWRWSNDGHPIQCTSLEVGPCSQATMRADNQPVSAQAPMPLCMSPYQDYCVESVKIYHDGSLPLDAQFQYETFADFAKPDIAPEFGIASLGNPLIFKSQTETSTQGSQLFMVQAGIHYMFKQENNFEPNIQEFKMSVFPIVDHGGDNYEVQSFQPGTRVQVALRAPRALGGWFKGRMHDTHAKIDPFDSNDYRLTIDGLNVAIPNARVTVTDSQLSVLKATDPGTWQWAQACDPGCGSIGEGDGGFNVVDDMRAYTNDTSSGVTTGWYIISFASPVSNCTKDTVGLAALITTNATAYTGNPPPLLDGALSYKVASLHLLQDGSVARGTYDFLINDQVARCIYDLPAEGDLAAKITVTEDGVNNAATTSFEDVDGFVHFAAEGFHYSVPLISASLRLAGPPMPPFTVLTNGTAKVGQLLEATANVAAGVSVRYQWLRDGQPIVGQTKASYSLSLADYGHKLSAQVTAIKKGLATTTHVSQAKFVGLGTQTKVPTPLVSGNAKVGTSLQAIPGTWDSGVALAYQWLRNGAPISGATAATYVPTAEDAGSQIAVKVTGSALGYASANKTSPAQTVGNGALNLTPVPVVLGESRVGATLTTSPGTWDQGSILSYQWLRNGQPINGATSATYVPTTSDLLQSLSVAVSASKPGFDSVSRTSQAARVALGVLGVSAQPTLLGDCRVGSTISVLSGTWDQGVSFGYRWLRDGQAITGATGSTFALSTADLNHKISVEVSGSKTGYASLSRISSQELVTPGSLVLTPLPVVAGVARPFAALHADSGTWDSGVELAYQWLKDGQTIPGATTPDYSLTDSDLQHSISVSVSGNRVGYAPVTVTSLGALVARGKLIQSPAPAISGSAVIGATLTAVSGEWDPGVRLSYQWMRDGRAIIGATTSTLSLGQGAIGHRYSVQVTGSLPGFDQVTRSSLETKAVPLQEFKLFNSIKVLGSLKVGKALSVKLPTLPAGTALKFQWMRSGKPIARATKLTYSVTKLDRHKVLSLKVSAALAGYKSAAVLVKVGSVK
jgi:hypothetical protein